MKTKDDGASLHAQADVLRDRLDAARRLDPKTPEALREARDILTESIGLTGPLLSPHPYRGDENEPVLSPREGEVFLRARDIRNGANELFDTCLAANFPAANYVRRISRPDLPIADLKAPTASSKEPRDPGSSRGGRGSSGV